MNLTPLNDLKERLENAIFAGTSLIKDDFRLKKAYENFLPLSEVNPVFAKIKAGMDAVMASEKDSLNAAILDTLSLIDAVVYTQAETAHDEGKLEEFGHEGFAQYREISHSSLKKWLCRRMSDPQNFACYDDYIPDFRFLPKFLKRLADGTGMSAERLNAEGISYAEKFACAGKTVFNDLPVLKKWDSETLLQFYVLVHMLDRENEKLLKKIKAMVLKEVYNWERPYYDETIGLIEKNGGRSC